MPSVTESNFGKKKVVNSILWKITERGSSFFVTILVNVLLARLLEPSVHGLLAMVTVFVTVSEHFLKDGLNVALVQSEKADTVDYSTALYINLIISAVLYLLFFITAPYIAAYFGYDELCPILRVLSISLIVWGLNAIQYAYVSRNMMFRKYFFSTLSGKIISGIIGVAMACLGCGVWALVAQSLSLVIVETVVVWFSAGWRPTLEFSWERGKKLLVFGGRTMLTGITETLTDQIRNLIIGKKYSSDDLAYYNKGSLFPTSITSNVSYAVSAVMLPVLSSKQDDRSKVLEGCRKWVQIFGYCMLPVLAGMAAVAPVLIPLLLTEKWISSVLYMRIICGVYASWAIEVPIREAIKASGRADICLRMQLIKAAFSLISVIAVMSYGVAAIAYSALVSAVFNIIVSVICGYRYLGYTPKMLACDILSTILLCAVMAAAVLIFPHFISSSLLCLAAQIVIGIAVYILGSAVTKNQSFNTLVSLVRGRT